MQIDLTPEEREIICTALREALAGERNNLDFCDDESFAEERRLENLYNGLIKKIEAPKRRRKPITHMRRATLIRGELDGPLR